MDKSKVKYLIDLGLAAAFICSFLTGLVKFPAVREAFLLTRRVLPYTEINLVHDWAGLLMGVLILLHLLFNFSWIVAMTRKYLKPKNP